MPTTKQNDLDAMSLDELRTLYHEVTGEETKDRAKKRLIARIEDARESIDALAKGKAIRAEAAAEAENAEPAQQKEGRKKAKADDAETPEADDGEKKPSKLTVDELREKHLELLGRETRSSNRTYLIWRVSQAEKGKIPTGPRARRASSGPCKVLPVRLPEAAVLPLGEAKGRLGFRSRNDLILRALHSFLDRAGETEVAALLAIDSAAE